ncbi:MAG TPA: carbonic anhydrase family protein [Terriglobales bacterium]|nr:carbonic anhydrase family protein [Terriglobales bacterium]
MKIVLVITAILIAGMAQAQDGQSPKHEWSYNGDEGPQRWGDLNPEYATCKLGQLQSPIDIRGAKKTPLSPIRFEYRASALKIINTGHSIQANYDPGSFISVGDKRYQLRQFHFHHPSEEQIEGKAYEMVVHLVHADADGHLAVIAVLLKSGTYNPIIQKLWDYLPTVEGKERIVSGIRVNAANLLPQSFGYYTFEGSLTTPPCSEGVTWFVLKAPREIAPDQVATFAKLYPHNARPTQPLNGRIVSEK